MSSWLIWSILARMHARQIIKAKTIIDSLAGKWNDRYSYEQRWMCSLGWLKKRKKYFAGVLLTVCLSNGTACTGEQFKALTHTWARMCLAAWEGGEGGVSSSAHYSWLLTIHTSYYSHRNALFAPGYTFQSWKKFFLLQNTTKGSELHLH